MARNKGSVTQFSSTNQPKKKASNYPSPEVRAIRSMTNEEIARVCEMVMTSDRTELAAVLADPTTPMMIVNLISAIISDTSKGLTYTLDKLLERTVGKPKTQIELSNDPNNPMNFSPVQILVSLPKNDRETDE